MKNFVTKYYILIFLLGLGSLLGIYQYRQVVLNKQKERARYINTGYDNNFDFQDEELSHYKKVNSVYEPVIDTSDDTGYVNKKVNHEQSEYIQNVEVITEDLTQIEGKANIEHNNIQSEQKSTNTSNNIIKQIVNKVKKLYSENKIVRKIIKKKNDHFDASNIIDNQADIHITDNTSNAYNVSSNINSDNNTPSKQITVRTSPTPMYTITQTPIPTVKTTPIVHTITPTPLHTPPITKKVTPTPTQTSTPPRTKLVCKPPFNFPQNKLKPVSYFQQKFDTVMAQSENWANIQASSGYARTYYYFNYYLRGLLAMYEATHDMRYLNKAVNYMVIMVDKAKDYDGDGLKGWADSTNTPRLHGEGFYEEQMIGIGPLVKASRIILKGKIKPLYPQALKILRFTEANFVPRKYDTGIVHHLEGYYLEIIYNLYAITGRQKYYNIIRDLAPKLYASTWPNIHNSQAIVWHSRLCKKIRYACYHVQGDCTLMPQYKDWEFNHCYPSDSSHANFYVMFVDRAYKDKLVYNSVYIYKLIHTLKDVMWNKSYTNIKFSDFVDGAQEPPDGKYHGSGVLGKFVAEGWILLGQYDPQIQYIMQLYVEQHDPNLFGSGGRLLEYGNLALNKKILDQKYKIYCKQVPVK